MGNPEEKISVQVGGRMSVGSQGRSKTALLRVAVLGALVPGRFPSLCPPSVTETTLTTSQRTPHLFNGFCSTLFDFGGAEIPCFYPLKSSSSFPEISVTTLPVGKRTWCRLGGGEGDASGVAGSDSAVTWALCL